MALRFRPGGSGRDIQAQEESSLNVTGSFAAPAAKVVVILETKKAPLDWAGPFTVNNFIGSYSRDNVFDSEMLFPDASVATASTRNVVTGNFRLPLLALILSTSPLETPNDGTALP